MLRPSGDLASRPERRTGVVCVRMLRDVPSEVAKRLRAAGFAAELNGDGVLAVKR